MSISIININWLTDKRYIRMIKLFRIQPAHTLFQLSHFRGRWRENFFKYFHFQSVSCHQTAVAQEIQLLRRGRGCNAKLSFEPRNRYLSDRSCKKQIGSWLTMLATLSFSFQINTVCWLASWHDTKHKRHYSNPSLKSQAAAEISLY